MKLLTLNTHSLIEKDYERKLVHFVSAAARLRPDIIALQEVNQTASGHPVKGDIHGYIPCRGDIMITEDNHAYRVCMELEKLGCPYYWAWLPIKNGYERFDEGIAVLSRKPIVKTDLCTISTINDYTNWKTRKVLGILTEDETAGWFYSVHMSWWEDTEESFLPQWRNLEEHLSEKNRVWLMGDFNNSSEARGEGYDEIISSGWHDIYRLAEKKDSGCTVGEVIDGWRDKISSTDGMRIDYILTNRKVRIKTCETVFNGKNEPVVSDHFGVIAETE